MKNFKTALFKTGLFVVSVLSTPFTALAAPQPPYVPLAPLPGMPASFDMTGSGLVDFLTNLYTIAIGISGVLAVVMLVICGIKMMGTPSASAKSEAKECIWNAIFGLLLAIGSWTLLNTINPSLLSTTLTAPASSVSLSVPPPGVYTTPPPTTTEVWYFQYIDIDGSTKNSESKTLAICAEKLRIMTENNLKTGNPPKPVVGADCKQVGRIAATASELAVRTALAGSNVFVNKGPCPSLTISFRTVAGGCSSVEGLNAVAAITGLSSDLGGNPGCTASSAARREPNCKVIVTGGTEAGHSSTAQTSSHAAKDGGIGQVFDLARNTDLEKYLKANAQKIAPSFTGMNRYLYKGYWYTTESDHFHVCQDGTYSWYCKSTVGNNLGWPLKCDASTPQNCYACDKAKATKLNPCP